MHDLEKVLQRIEARLVAVGLSAHAASLLAGKGDAIRNIRRAVQEGKRRGVSTATINALAPILQTSPSWLLHGIDLEKPSQPSSKRGAVRAVEPNVRMVEVRGTVQAGHWEEAWEWGEDDRYTIPIPDDEGFRAFQLFGVETRGPSMDKRYPEGTVVVVTDVVERGEDIQPGRRYVVEREGADGLREATIKTLWRDDVGSLWLLPESSDPRFQVPIALNGDEGDTIRIVGRVVYAVTREP